MIDFDRLSRRERFASYYSTIEASSPAPGIPTKWMYQLSCGMRFDVDGHLDDTAPIFFTRFAWADGKMACRVPFSIAALLEAGAMYFEFVANQLAIPKLPSSKQPIEQQAFASRTIDELYTPELGLYSNGVHLISNVLGLSSAAEAFPYAGCLASLCLNLPSRYFESLVIPSKFAQWGDRNAAAITRRERGFAFLVLTHHGANCERNSPIEWVESAAKASGLPGLSELQEAISEEYDSLVQRCSNGPYRPQFDNLVSAGRNFIQAMGVIPTAESVLQDFLSLPLPPIVCSDNQVRQVGSSRLFADDYEFDSWIEEIEQVTAQMHEFVDACGV